MLRVKLAALLLLGSIATGCAGKPPPPPPPPPAPAPPPPPPPPPPAPVDPAQKCHALTDKCLAEPDTKLAIGHNVAVFRPPAGWTFANEGDVSLAVAPHEKALVAFSVAVGDDRPARIAALDRLLARLGIDGVAQKKLKERLKKPQMELAAAGAKIQLWEVDKKSQRGKAVQLRGQGAGTLLVVTAALGDKRIVGCGFVVKPEAEADAATIMQSVQSLEGPPAEGQQPAAGPRLEGI